MGKTSTYAPIRSAGVMGTARWKGGAGNGGGPFRARGRDPRRRIRFGGPPWESDGVMVPLKPGNAGGGKDPDFWYAC